MIATQPNSQDNSPSDFTPEDPAVPQREIPQTSNRRLTIEIAGAAIFSALSIVFGMIDLTILRVPGWYIAYFDPISLIWIMAFLIFGVRAGIITAIIGTIGLMPIDPTIWIGPLMKFFSTIWFILIPFFWARLRSKDNSVKNVQKLSNYIPSVIIAWVVRCLLMMVLNYLILTYMFFMIDDMTLGWLGFEHISGLTAVLVTLLIINTLQSVFDVVIPYILVFKTPIYSAVSQLRESRVPPQVTNPENP